MKWMGLLAFAVFTFTEQANKAKNKSFGINVGFMVPIGG